jgi:hypothetical protein
MVGAEPAVVDRQRSSQQGLGLGGSSGASQYISKLGKGARHFEAAGAVERRAELDRAQQQGLFFGKALELCAEVCQAPENRPDILLVIPGIALEGRQRPPVSGFCGVE